MASCIQEGFSRNCWAKETNYHLSSCGLDALHVILLGLHSVFRMQVV